MKTLNVVAAIIKKDNKVSPVKRDNGEFINMQKLFFRDKIEINPTITKVKGESGDMSLKFQSIILYASRLNSLISA